MTVQHTLARHVTQIVESREELWHRDNIGPVTPSLSEYFTFKQRFIRWGRQQKQPMSIVFLADYWPISFLEVAMSMQLLVPDQQRRNYWRIVRWPQC